MTVYPIISHCIPLKPIKSPFNGYWWLLVISLDPVRRWAEASGAQQAQRSCQEELTEVKSSIQRCRQVPWSSPGNDVDSMVNTHG